MVLYEPFFAAHNWKPPWSTKEFDRTDHEIKHHDAIGSGIFSDDFRGKCPQKWTNQVALTKVKAT
jgi:hypothetical protein